jgi:hypothetical protein
VVWPKSSFFGSIMNLHGSCVTKHGGILYMHTNHTKHVADAEIVVRVLEHAHEWSLCIQLICSLSQGTIGDQRDRWLMHGRRLRYSPRSHPRYVGVCLCIAPACSEPRQASCTVERRRQRIAARQAAHRYSYRVATISQSARRTIASRHSYGEDRRGHDHRGRWCRQHGGMPLTAFDNSGCRSSCSLTRCPRRPRLGSGELNGLAGVRH